MVKTTFCHPLHIITLGNNHYCRVLYKDCAISKKTTSNNPLQIANSGMLYSKNANTIFIMIPPVQNNPERSLMLTPVRPSL